MNPGDPSPRGVRFSEANIADNMADIREDSKESIHPLPKAAQPGALARNESNKSSSSTDSDVLKQSSDDDVEGQFDFTPAIVTTPIDDVPALVNNGGYTWASGQATRGRGLSAGQEISPAASS